MRDLETPTGRYTNRLHEPYTPFSDAPFEAPLPSLAEQLGGEPYPTHATRWYEWLASAFHIALLAVGVTLLVFG